MIPRPLTRGEEEPSPSSLAESGGGSGCSVCCRSPVPAQPCPGTAYTSLHALLTKFTLFTVGTSWGDDFPPATKDCAQGKRRGLGHVLEGTETWRGCPESRGPQALHG